MKSIKPLLTLAASAIIVLSSCSQQRYASRKKVHIGEQAKQEIKHEPKKEVTGIASKDVVLNAEIEETQPAQVNPAPEPAKKEVVKKLRSKKTVNYLKQVTKSPEKVKELLNKEDNIQKEEFKSETGLDVGNRWVKLMILGLIIMIVGAILAWVLGIGGLISWIGSLIFVVGLILWLIEIIV